MRKERKKDENDYLEDYLAVNTRVFHDFSKLPMRFPRGCLRYITPSLLLKEGFRKINEENYEKTFSGLLKLRVEISRDWGKFYAWTLNEENFQKMIDDLKVIRAHMDTKVKELHKRVFSVNKGTGGSVQSKIHGAAKTVHNMQKDFYKKYKDFLALTHDIEITIPYLRSEYFFFDACRTKRQLHLCFTFAELFLEVFGILKKSSPPPRRIAHEEIKQSVVAYYAMLRTIRKIRKMYQEGVSFDELKTKFSIRSDQYLEDITLDAQNKKGWAYKASDVALKFASWICNTTPDNFQQILKKEKDFALKIKRRISKIQDVEKVLTSEMGVKEPFLTPLTTEQSKEEFFESLRFSLSHYFPPPRCRMALKKR